ncbi:MAG TPA: thiamine phosphate synthase [Rhizomicrobium sp.]
MADGLARANLARAAARLNRHLGCPLPALVYLTDDDRAVDPLSAVRALPRRSLVILRARDDSRRVALAAAIASLARQYDLRWIVAGDPDLASRTGADGAHFPEARMAEAHHWRALRPHWLITCAAHSLTACLRIARFGADAALLAPVFATQSHSDGKSLGPIRLRFIARQSPVPVYALGGIDAGSAVRLAGSRLAGLAAVRGLCE